MSLTNCTDHHGGSHRRLCRRSAVRSSGQCVAMVESDAGLVAYQNGSHGSVPVQAQQGASTRQERKIFMKLPTFSERNLTLEYPEHHHTRTIRAQVARNGLAYHLLPLRGGLLSTDFIITHVRSGRALLNVTPHLTFATEEECQRFIMLVDRLFDWRKSASEINQHRDLLASMRSIAKYLKKGKRR